MKTVSVSQVPVNFPFRVGTLNPVSSPVMCNSAIFRASNINAHNRKLSNESRFLQNLRQQPRLILPGDGAAELAIEDLLLCSL